MRFAGLFLLSVAMAAPVAAKEFPPPVTPGKDGRLAYEALAPGDRVPDYSHAGYRGGGVALPVVPDPTSPRDAATGSRPMPRACAAPSSWYPGATRSPGV